MWEQELGTRGRLVVLPCDCQTVFIFWHIPEVSDFNSKGDREGGSFFLRVVSSELEEEKGCSAENRGEGTVISVSDRHGSCYARVRAGSRIKAVLYTREGGMDFPCLFSNTVAVPRCFTSVATEEAATYSSLQK